jgi:ABC-type nitrate/sulfonate/bicarbonate transport system substrate-binding protein
MTGSVPDEALAAIRRGASADVEVLVVGTGEIAGIEGSIDLLFIGPAAPYSVAAELFSRWPGRVAPGGLLFVHGAFAAPPLTAALLRAIGSSRAWRYYDRDGALAEYVRADLTHGERVLDAIAQLAQLAYFTRRMARRRLRRQNT